MATAESVKVKLQGLINKANAKTGKNDTDLTTAVTALVEGYGQGGGSVSGGYCNIECYYVDSVLGDLFISTLKETLQSIGANPSITFEVVDALPQNPRESDFATFSVFNVYIYNDVPYAYGNAGAGNMWLGLTDLMAAQGVAGVTANGFTFNIESETEEGIYVTYDEISENGCDKLRNELAQTYAKYESEYDLVDKLIQGFGTNFDFSEHKVEYVSGFAYYPLITITLPKTARFIQANAFEGCTDLTTVNGMESIQMIRASAFQYCKALESISLGVGLTHIEPRAFYQCEALRRIDYNGTKAQWKEIEKGSNWSSFTPDDLTIYCTDGAVDVLGYDKEV